MEYVLGFVIILWIISSFIYRRSKFEPTLDSLIEELEYKKSLISGVKIEQPKSKPKPKHKYKPLVPYSDSTPEVEPIKQLMFISAKDKLEYMQSEKWRIKRNAVFVRDNNTCQSCGSTDRLECHHIDYTMLGDEPLEHLITVCRQCHQAVHDRLGYSRETYYNINLK